MKLSQGEKLITLMLCDLFKKLDVESELDPEFISDAIYSGNTWAIEEKHVGIPTEENEIGDDVVKTVHETLDMYRTLEDAVARFSEDEQAELIRLAPTFGKDVKWPGFDGNNEGEYGSAAGFMIEKMGWHGHFKDRAHLNSHSHSLDSTARMLSAYKPIMQNNGFNGQLTVQEIADIVNEQIHPSNRK